MMGAIAIRPLFADGIDIPIVFFAGIIVLLPLLVFEVVFEALVLRKMWRLPYRELCKLTFFANCWSLVAGIPTKILNGFIYSALLPDDIPGFFARYPFAAAIGSLIYFVVTVLVEGMYAFRWLKRNQITRSPAQIWRGMLLANLVTYAVLAPLNYFATRPHNEIRQFSNDTHWTSHPATTILFIDSKDQYLKSIQADGSGLKTIVPIPMADYLVSTNLNVCLFRGTNGNLYLYRHDAGQTNLIWQTNERFFMSQVAFSPSGQLVAFASFTGDFVQFMDVGSGYRRSSPVALNSRLGGLAVAWSSDERKFFVANDKGMRLMVTMDAKDDPVITPLEGTNAPSVLKCYGRLGNGAWWGGGDWGVNYRTDTCGDLEARSARGLVSGLRIYHPRVETDAHVITLTVNPGLLHFGGFDFGDVEFLDGCDECLFDANGYIYILDINGKRLGTLARGDRFIQLTPRFEKVFPN